LNNKKQKSGSAATSAGIFFPSSICGKTAEQKNKTLPQNRNALQENMGVT
jgi:hypothetical protein